MIDRFNWCFFCAVLILLIAFPPNDAGATADMQVAGTEPRSVFSDSGLSEASLPFVHAETMASLLESPAQPKAEGARQLDGNFSISGKRSLAGLFGRSEISVLADIGDQYVRNLNEYLIIGEEFARRIDETNLAESIRSGRSFSRESLAALARKEQAEAQTGQALALLLPSISVRLNSGSETSRPSVVVDETTGQLIAADTHSRTDFALNASQPLFDLPHFLDWRRRKVIEQARGEDYRISDGDAYISTVSTYLSLVFSRLQTKILRDFQAQLDDLLVYIEKRADAGAASVSDMARVKARSQETLSFRLEQESTHATAWVEFIRLTNIIPRNIRLPKIEDVGASSLPESFDAAVARAMECNPEIAALKAELRAAKINQSAAKGLYLPRLDAEYTYNKSIHAGGDPSSKGQRDERIMAVLSWDLFSGGRDYRIHAERSARHKELLYSLDEERRRVIQTLSANYESLATTRSRIDSGYQELTSISTAAEAMSKRMLSGNQSLLDLLDVYDRVYQARLRLVKLHVLEMNTVAQLVRLTLGTPWALPEEAVRDEGT